jgi:hypothetical protein
MTLNRHKAGMNLALQRAPDLIVANPLCCHPGQGQWMHFNRLERREFITLLGAAAAWPLEARAQQPERVRRVGVLHTTASDDPEGQAQRSVPCRDSNNSVGPMAVTCASKLAGRQAMPIAFADSKPRPATSLPSPASPAQC